MKGGEIIPITELVNSPLLQNSENYEGGSYEETHTVTVAYIATHINDHHWLRFE